MSENYSRRNWAGMRREAYGQSFPAESPEQRADDLRRNYILDYALKPEEGETAVPRNMWREMARSAIGYGGNDSETLAMDIGMSGGYTIEMLLAEGYKGQIYGVDLHTHHFPDVERRLWERFPEAKNRVILGRANAERLREIRHQNGDRQPVRQSMSDFTIVANVLHHTGEPIRVLKAAHRATKQGGIVIFAGRHIEHLQNIYQLGSLIAEHYGAAKPVSYYHDYDLIRLADDLEADDGYEILYRDFQGTERLGDVWHITDEGLYIPETGWQGILKAVHSLLPMMKNKSSGKTVSVTEANEFMEEYIRPTYFSMLEQLESSSSEPAYPGYAFEPIAQGYFVCRVVK